MKFNKWTLGLAAVGAVSLTSAVRADEAKLTPLNTALSNTTISGYVDVADSYTTGNVPESGSDGSGGGFDSIRDIFDIAIDKPLDESAWSAGYHIEFTGGDTPIFNPQYGNQIRQAYVALRTPVGNGIDWKIGIQDDVIGYESNTGYLNPNYSHSFGYGYEPTTLVGVIGTYKIIDAISIQGGFAENNSTLFDGGYSSPFEVSSKTFVGAVALTAPDSWGFLKGATLNAGVLANIYKGGGNNYYAGLTLPTPISALKLGLAFDAINYADEGLHDENAWVVGAYASYQATDKLSLNGRAEYNDGTSFNFGGVGGRGEEVTVDVAYNLWANVLSRAEVRWDHADTDGNFNDSGNDNNFTFAVNVVYQF